MAKVRGFGIFRFTLSQLGHARRGLCVRVGSHLQLKSKVWGFWLWHLRNYQGELSRSGWLKSEPGALGTCGSEGIPSFFGFRV